jgi:serine/threonine protein kinase
LPAEKRVTTAGGLLRELRRHGNLTAYQAEAVAEGKADRLVLGNYVLLDRLGKGGMGEVYKARHRRMDRVVALKVVASATASSDEVVQRFHREMKIAARLSHPNVVTAHDADEAKGTHFLVMECVDGEDLASLVRRQGPLSIAEAGNCVLQAARGLEYAHRQQVIHRDIKPSNLILDRLGTVKILDMGLARLKGLWGSADPVSDEELTRSGQMMGTLDYMAPEQSMDIRHADARSDIYSLGCTLYYLLIGRPVYPADTITKRLLAHREAAIPSLRAACPGVPESLDQTFQKMLAKKPEDRQQNMSEVIEALAPCPLPARKPLRSLATPRDEQAETQSYLDDQPIDTTTLPRSSEPAGPAAQPPRSPVPAPVAASRRFSARKRLALAVALGGLFLAAAAAVLLTLRTSAGTLTVEVSEPGAKVEILDAEGTVTVSGISGAERLVFSVEPGKHLLHVRKDGFEFYAQEFEMHTRGKHVVRAVLRSPSRATPASREPADPPATPTAAVVNTQRRESAQPTASSPLVGFEFSRADADSVSQVASFTNMIVIMDWGDWGEEVPKQKLQAAADAGMTIVLRVYENQRDDREADLHRVLDQKPTHIHAVLWRAWKPNVDEILKFGRDLKARHPGVAYWVDAGRENTAAMSNMPTIDPVDVLVSAGYAGTVGQARHLVAAAARESRGRPVVAYWSAFSMDDPAGNVHRTEKGVFRALLEAAHEERIAGVIFAPYASRGQLQGIAARPELIEEIKEAADRLLQK